MRNTTKLATAFYASLALSVLAGGITVLTTTKTTTMKNTIHKIFGSGTKGAPWMHEVKENPDRQDFDVAWATVFGFKPADCVLLSKGHLFGPSNTGFAVETPNETIFNGGFGEFTDTPRLKPGQDIYYSGCGCTWDTDEDGKRFYLVSKQTGKPLEYEEALATETIRRYAAKHDISGFFKQPNKD